VIIKDKDSLHFFFLLNAQSYIFGADWLSECEYATFCRSIAKTKVATCNCTSRTKPWDVGFKNALIQAIT